MSTPETHPAGTVGTADSPVTPEDAITPDAPAAAPAAPGRGGELLSLTDVAQRMGIGPKGVRSLVKEGGLLAVRREGLGLVVPADLLDGDVPVKHLRGVLTLLRDARYDDEEALQWLTTEDDSLPGTPLQALHENRATEVKRRAQALGF
jgi:hypothetical protein